MSKLDKKMDKLIKFTAKQHAKLLRKWDATFRITYGLSQEYLGERKMEVMFTVRSTKKLTIRHHLTYIAETTDIKQTKKWLKAWIGNFLRLEYAAD